MNLILIMIAVVAGMLLVEKLWPANDLPKVTNWWPRVILTNLVQAGIVLILGATYDRWIS